MVGRPRFFAECRCVKRELDASEVHRRSDDIWLFINPYTCTVCYNMVIVSIILEPDWPKLLRGL